MPKQWPQLAFCMLSCLCAISVSFSTAMAEESKTQSSFWDDGLTRAKSGTWFWDNGITQAKSGVEGDLYDPNDSTSKSGLKTPPQWYFIPPDRYYENVDPNEIPETRKKDYVPYAVAMFPQNVNYRGIVINKGYYQIKLGGGTEGSPKTNLQALAANPPKAQQTNNFTPSGLPQYAPTPGDAFTPETIPAVPQTGRTLILKKLGNVIAVLPVERVESYRRSKGEKKAKLPLAKVFFEQNQPVLKLLYKDRLYVTNLGY